MAVQTKAAADALLKEFYLPAVRNQLNNDIKLLKEVEKDSEHVEGRRAVLSLKTSRNWGIGSRAELGTLPTAGRQGYSEERVPMYYHYGVGGVTGPMLAAGVSDRGSFARPLKEELSGITDDLKRDINRQLFGTSDGVIATFALTTSSVQLQLSTSYTTTSTVWNQLSENMVIDVGTIAAPTLKASAVTISSVVPPTSDTAGNGYIIVGSAVTTTGTDFLFISGNGGNTANSTQKEVTGLQTIVDSTGTLHNVAATGVWKSVELSNSGTNRSLTEQLIARACGDIHIASGKDPNLGIGSIGVYRAYAAVLTSIKRFNNTQTLKGGWQGLTFEAGTQPFPITWDRDCPNNTLFLLNTDHLTEFQSSDWDFMDEDGTVLLRTGTTDAYQFVLHKYMEFATDQRNTHGKVTDLTEVSS